uniref:Uncharacterized protein n=1 Tax=Eutreptiella gymnastica TaxID=73025 RepID=A0A7S1JFF0_9EUGL|mmetsp:Transcript_9208/g.16354  ORF Transcript_9208/g.16354 Transcript_9208/m.16354 type:complete len:130 (+) Transcript_9208:282-671(+)
MTMPAEPTSPTKKYTAEDNFMAVTKHEAATINNPELKFQHPIKAMSFTLLRQVGKKDITLQQLHLSLEYSDYSDDVEICPGLQFSGAEANGDGYGVWACAAKVPAACTQHPQKRCVDVWKSRGGGGAHH